MDGELPFLSPGALLLWLAHDGVFPFSALTFDAVHQAARPDKFGCEQAQAKENREDTRPRRDEHHHTCQQQGKPSNHEEDSADLFDRAEDHQLLG